MLGSTTLVATLTALFGTERGRQILAALVRLVLFLVIGIRRRRRGERDELASKGEALLSTLNGDGEISMDEIIAFLRAAAAPMPEDDAGLQAAADGGNPRAQRRVRRRTTGRQLATAAAERLEAGGGNLLQDLIGIIRLVGDDEEAEDEATHLGGIRESLTEEAPSDSGGIRGENSNDEGDSPRRPDRDGDGDRRRAS